MSSLNKNNMLSDIKYSEPKVDVAQLRDLDPNKSPTKLQGDHLTLNSTSSEVNFSCIVKKEISNPWLGLGGFRAKLKVLRVNRNTMCVYYRALSSSEKETLQIQDQNLNEKGINLRVNTF